MLHAAVIGLGRWGQQIITSIQGKSEKLRAVRGVDVAADGLRDFAAEHGIALASDYQDALDDPGVDAVILTTPNSLHEEQVLRAVAAGKQVFCEKPLSLSRASASKMVRACAEAGQVLGVGHERRYEPAMEEIARLVSSGALGTIMHVEANCSHDKMKALDPGHWRGSPVDAPAAGMTGMGVHLTDLFINMVGPVRTVYAQTAQRVLPLPSGDVVCVQMGFESGAIGVVAAVSATPFFGRLAIFGSDGWVETRDDAYVYDGGRTRLTLRGKDGERQTREFEAIDTVRANLEAWVDAVAGRGAYRFTESELVHNVAVLEAIAKSAASGAAEAVPS
ncbi:MAG: Gfo/Idh/MocA family oxidoreductase [Dehalococcoidia bacterium]